MKYNYEELKLLIETGVLFERDKEILLDIISQTNPKKIIEQLNEMLGDRKVFDIYIYNSKDDSFSRFDHSHYINLTKKNKVIGLSKLPLELQKLLVDYYFYGGQQ